MNNWQINSLVLSTRQKWLATIIMLMLSLSFINGFRLANAATKKKCTVLKIYDGDTVTLRCRGMSKKISVRLHCIDTPEIKQKPWGIRSRDYLRSLIWIGKVVGLKQIGIDRYRRVIGEVYRGNLNLNVALVRAGQAAVYNKYCRTPKYKTAERRAKRAKLGIWSQHGLHQNPWEWRKQNRRGRK